MVSFIRCPINNAVLVNTFQKRKAKGRFDWSATGLKEKEMTWRRWRKNISDSVVTLLVMPHSWIERTYIIISITIMEDCQKIKRKSLPTLRVSLFFFHLIHVFLCCGEPMWIRCEKVVNFCVFGRTGEINKRNKGGLDWLAQLNKANTKWI